MALNNQNEKMMDQIDKKGVNKKLGVFLKLNTYWSKIRYKISNKQHKLNTDT